MLTIELNQSTAPEFCYILDLILLPNSLKTEICIHENNSTDVVVSTSSGNRLIINQSYDFFDTNPDKDLQLMNSFIANPLSMLNSQSGNDGFKKDKGKESKQVEFTLPFNPLAWVYFFFSEEKDKGNVSNVKDRHSRKVAATSLLKKLDLLERPIINEILNSISQIFSFIDPAVQLKSRTFRKLISCDVDWPYDLSQKSILKSFRQTVKLAKHGDLISLHKPLVNYTNKGQNPDFDIFHSRIRWIMDVNERVNNKVAFNYIPLQTDPKYDGCYQFDDPRIIKQLHEVASRGHEIGIHPGYNTYNNSELFKKSVGIFRRVLEKEGLLDCFSGGRQHYLRWSFPETPRLWEEAEIKYDSTLGFADQAGFRCGICHEFPLFDIEQRRVMNLMERPLVLMETSVIDYMGYGRTYKARDYMMSLKRTCQKFNGDFTLLWHHTTLNTDWDREVYKELIT